MIVVDVGCHPHGREESVYKLAARFRPAVLFGFDPYPELVEGVEWYWQESSDRGPSTNTAIVRRRAAAWTRTERLAYRVEGHEGVAGIASGITTFGDAAHEEVDAIDLGSFLMSLPDGEGIVLKLDCEGAEYVLTRDLHERGIDRRLALLLVEWHPEETSHGMYVRPGHRCEMRCQVEEW